MVRCSALVRGAVGTLIVLISPSPGAPAPVVVYGPEFYEAPPSSPSPGQRLSPGSPVPLDRPLRVGSGQAFVLVAPGQLLRLAPGTEAVLSSGGAELLIRAGTVTLHAETPKDSLQVWLVTEEATIRNLGDQLCVVINGQSRRLLPGDVVRGDRTLGSWGPWIEDEAADGRYLFRLIREGALPARQYPFRLPSLQPRLLRHDLHGYAGIATYEGARYYLLELTYRLKAWHLRLAYDLWFAIRRDGRFYSEAWDQWKDLVDHVNHIQLFLPGDPFFMRLGHIDGLSYGRGLLLDSYTNSVFIPFERRTGLVLEGHTARLTARAFVNDVGRPRVAGGVLRWSRRDHAAVMLTYLGDVDQYSNLRDSDGDSYPDAVDPEPDVANTPADSIIREVQPIRLDSLPRQALHGVALGFDYRALKTERTELRIEGEAAALIGKGLGMNFPALTLRWGGLTLGVGLDFQTPRFEATVFDGTYELDKARFVLQPDSTLRLVTRGHELARTDEWLFGWSNRAALKIANRLSIESRFRDVHRGDYRNKLFRLSVETSFPFMEPVTRIGAFIEQRNVSRLLRERIDGEIWGVEARGALHRSLLVRLRFRERYSDTDNSGAIEKDEVRRSLSASMTVDGSYWWHRFRQWRQGRGEDEPVA